MSLESQVEASNVLESCITELRSWLISNRFMINDIKTEFLIIGSRHQLAKTTIDSIVKLALNPQRAFESLDRGLMLKCV